MTPPERSAAGLAESGWSVCTDFLPPEQIAALAAELRDRWDAGAFRPAGVGVGADLRLRPEIRSDRVHWLEETAQTSAEAPYFTALEALRLAINRELYLGLYAFEGHMTLYPPGSFYRKHLDQFRGTAHRKVSVILYLNADWATEHGGQLRLYLEPSGDGPHHDVLPHGGTLACFLSERFHHEVLPATRERMSITGWFKVRAAEGGFK
ncbi:MAG: 2OG-Fe(II) oxygenase [Gammaproteobacteria bacterium]